MNYRKDKYGNDISILGYGCMRFTQSAGKPDMLKAEKEIMEAYRAGVNYYDTAYIYPGSEACLGEILERNNIRDKVNIATKLPHYLVKSKENMEKYFQEELKRLRTDYIDYYLMHMLTDVKTWKRLRDLGILEWLEEKKANKQIRQIGFSYHGNTDTFIQLIDSYDWDFCQIQYNYMDENSQAGRKGLQYANSKGIPVVIMEPLRGGKLVSRLPQQAINLFNSYPKKYTPAGWAFRWLWNQPEVTCVLSGMNSIEMVKENVQSASTAFVGDFKESEEKLLKEVVSIINAKMKVGCTGCRYCMPCPKGVDIPGTFAAYNRRYSEGYKASMIEYVMNTALRKDSTAASNCIGCGKCEMHCPQHIEIRKELKNACKVMEGPVYKIARKVILLFRAY
ncbi:MAG: aldo/keto reductase [Holdemanella sp.]|nr:aldo/keto reductase [Holdemanella sp.]